MALLDGFKLVELKEKVEESRLTISAKSLKFNRGTAKNLGFPSKIRFFLNEKRVQIAITSTEEDDEDGVDFSCKEGTREVPIIVKEPAVLEAVKTMALLEKNGMQLRLTVRGVVYLEDKTIIYDLTEATEEVVKPRVKRAVKGKE